MAKSNGKKATATPVKATRSSTRTAAGGKRKANEKDGESFIAQDDDLIVQDMLSDESDVTDDEQVEVEVQEAEKEAALELEVMEAAMAAQGDAEGSSDGGDDAESGNEAQNDDDDDDEDDDEDDESESDNADDEGEDVEENGPDGVQQNIDEERDGVDLKEPSSSEKPVSLNIADKKQLGTLTIGVWKPSDDLDDVSEPDNNLRHREVVQHPPIEVVSSDTDTSEDEHSRNTLGKIPMEWYEDYEHLGYDLNGKKVSKPKQKDRLDKFLDRMDNPAYGRTIFDPVTGKEIELTDEDIDMIKRIQGGQLPDATLDPYAPYIDFFTHVQLQTPVVDVPEPKRRYSIPDRFVPSKWEHKKIMKIVRSIRKGRIRIGPKPKEEQKFYDIWGQSEEDPRMLARHDRHVTAPKLTLPKHDESYNPPPAEEAEQWKQAHEDDREKNYLPQKYGSLRLVPAYDHFVQERFHRCLDLYLCPRARRVKLNLDLDALIPKLPKPQDLQPFPTAISITFQGHTARVTCISPDPTGQWLASGSDDKTIRVWEVLTGRCMNVLKVANEVNSIEWCPNPSTSLIVVGSGNSVYLMNPLVASNSVQSSTDDICRQPAPANAQGDADTITWIKANPKLYAQGHRFKIEHSQEVTWHRKGNYFAAVMPQGASKSVCVHSLLKQSTQYPFKKKNHDIQRVLFHDKQPLFFVATKTHVRVYNLQTQTLVKKLITGVRWISSLALHPGGDNIIIGSYDRRLCWFDLDLSIKPYKTLRYHRFALRQVAYHRTYPLFASCCDDGSVHILHGMVYNDLSKNPLIVPVKILKAHVPTNDLGVLDCQFHPHQPWIFTAGADCDIHLFT